MNLSHFTIGKKITLGFSLLFGVLVVVAVLAYVALGGAGQRLATFVTSADETYAAASLESSMQDLKLQLAQRLFSHHLISRQLQRNCSRLSGQTSNLIGLALS